MINGNHGGGRSDDFVVWADVEGQAGNGIVEDGQKSSRFTGEGMALHEFAQHEVLKVRRSTTFQS